MCPSTKDHTTSCLARHEGKSYFSIREELTTHLTMGGGGFATGIFRCGKFRTSNVCVISCSILRPLCEIKSCRNLATLATPPPRLGWAGVLLPVALVAKRHVMPSSLAVFEAPHPGHGASSMKSSAPALVTHYLVFFAVGSLSLPHADMEAETGAETDTEIDAADELMLVIAWDEEEARSVSEPRGEISAFCALSCSQLASLCACLLPVPPQ